MKQVNVAVVGVGYWGPNLIRNFAKVPGVNVSYICDSKKSQLNKIYKDYPSIKRTQKFEDLLNDSSVDLVAIATPLSTHYALAKRALEANKHVFIEKPMTQTSLEAKELIQIAKKANKILMVGHTFIYSSAVQKIKEYINQKKLGDIYYYDSTRINLGGFQKDTSVLWDLATHDLAILSYIFPQKIISVSAISSNFTNSKNADAAHIFLRLAKNTLAHIHVSWLSPVKIRTILIGGNKRMIVYNDIEATEKVKIYENDVLSMSKVTPFAPAFRSGRIVIPKLSQEETMLSELTHLIDCIRKNKMPMSDGKQGLDVIILLESIERSLKMKKEIFINDN